MGFSEMNYEQSAAPSSQVITKVYYFLVANFDLDGRRAKGGLGQWEFDPPVSAERKQQREGFCSSVSKYLFPKYGSIPVPLFRVANWPDLAHSTFLRRCKCANSPLAYQE